MADTNIPGLKAEARHFGRYLLGRPIDDTSVRLYVKALQARPGSARGRDARLLRFATRHPRAVGLLDAGAALVMPNTELRRRLFILFSILESRPAYADYFLPKAHSVWQVIGIGLRAMQAAGKVVIGAVLVKVVAR